MVAAMGHAGDNPDFRAGVRLLARLARVAEQACQTTGISLPQYRLLVTISGRSQRASELVQTEASRAATQDPINIPPSHGSTWPVTRSDPVIRLRIAAATSAGLQTRCRAARASIACLIG